jgi:phenylacetate-CoA ligase
MRMSLLAEYYRLKQQQWKSRDEIDAIALAKLRRQLTRAWQYSRFYRQRFDEIGFHPEDLKSLADLQRLPLTSRADYVGASDSIYCSDIDISKCIVAKSSGSSGAPVRVPLTPYDKSYRVLKELRQLTAVGFKFTDRMLVIWVPRITIDRIPAMHRLGLLRREHASVFDEESVQLDNINKLRPDVLYTFTSNYRILAEEILSKGAEIFKPKLLISSAELMDDTARNIVKKAFGLNPYDYYGSMEFGWIAWQCPERNYHINSDSLIVECVRDGVPVPPGEEGELVVTCLHSDAAPLIRYVLGDSVKLSTERCECGRELPIMNSVTGRIADYFVLPGGRRISPYSVTSALRDVPGMRRFQVVQETADFIRVNVLKDGGAPGPEVVQTTVMKALGVRLNVAVDYVECLPREASGKFKIVKSMILPDSEANRHDVHV